MCVISRERDHDEGSVFTAAGLSDMISLGLIHNNIAVINNKPLVNIMIPDFCTCAAIESLCQ